MSRETQNRRSVDNDSKEGGPLGPQDSMEDQKSSVERLIQQAYSRLKDLDAVSALGFLKEALKIDYEHPEVKYGLKCVNWWLERVKRLDDFHEPYEKGAFVISQWRSFHTFLNQIGEAYDSCQYALRRFAFSLALNFFGEVLENAGNHLDPEILLQIGRCYKGLGSYEEAVMYLEQAIRYRPEDSGALAELADVNALLGDPRAAQVLFREAFFLDPQSIDLWSMESDMIIRLRQKVAELGYEGRDVAEWIPVYGALWGFFSVIRELKPIEISRLKQSILALESEAANMSGTQKAAINWNKDQKNKGPVSMDRSPGDFIRPRLLNRYFRLYNHYRTSQGGNARDYSELMEDIMRKIRLIDSEIYEQFRN